MKIYFGDSSIELMKVLEEKPNKNINYTLSAGKPFFFSFDFCCLFWKLLLLHLVFYLLAIPSNIFVYRVLDINSGLMWWRTNQR